MAFVQQHRPNSARQVSHHAPETATEAASSSQQLKRPLEASDEWVLFSPAAPSTTARTQTTSTERTPRTAGLSRFSEFGSLDTAARSEQEDDDGTEEDLDSLDEGLHAFHEPSDYGAPVGRPQQNGDTVLPTHDGMGEFQPNAGIQEHMWQFERPRRRAVRRRSSVQRHFGVLDDADQIDTEHDRRQRIEKWRLEQSKALLEEIEKETRRRRRMSTSSAARSRVSSTQQESTDAPRGAPPVQSTQSDSSEEGTADLSFWQRITRSVIRDLIGLDENTLSIIFGETLPGDRTQSKAISSTDFSADKALQDAGIDISNLSDSWQTKLLERVAQELGTLVHQLSEHPGAFSTFQNSVSDLDYAGLTKPILPSTTLPPKTASSNPPSGGQTSTSSPASAQFAPTFPLPTSHMYSEASLWGIEEEPDHFDTQDTISGVLPPATTVNTAEDLAREREYWEREIDVKMIFNFLVKRFTSRQTSASPPQSRVPSTASPVSASSSSIRDNASSARRAAIIRQNHPLVSRTADRALPTSSASFSRENQTYRAYFAPQSTMRHHSHHHHHHQKLKSQSSCASQSTKKSKRSNSSSRNYWDLGGSVGSVAGGA